MATANWFNYDFYMNAKLAQMVASDPTGDWTLPKLVQTFGTAGFVGPEGGQAHFEGFGQNEGLSPNEFFNPQEYYSAKAAEFYNKAPSAVTPLDAANIELLIKNAGMNAWSHYTAFGSAEGVNPSNNFDSSKYMDAKLATMKTADPTGAWDMPKLVKAFQDAGLSALEHFMMFGGTGPGEVAQKYDPAKPSIPAEFAVPESEKVNAGGGETFTLTENIDNFVGTSGNDTFIGDIDTTSAADQVTGGAGTDTLKLYGATTVAPNYSGIENIELIGRSATAFDTSGKSDVKSVTVNGAVTAASTITVAAGQAVILSNSNIGANVATTAANTSLAVTLNKLGVAGTPAVVDFAGAALTTVDLDVAGDSVITLSNDQKLETLNISGAGKVVIDADTVGSLLTTVNAASATGNVSILLEDDTSPKNVTVTGGAGNDTANFGAAFTKDDKFDGGAGTDTLELTQLSVTTVQGYSAAADIAAVRANLTNIEVLKLTDALTGDIDASRFGSVNQFVLNAGYGVASATTSHTISKVTSGVTVTINNAAVDANDTLAVEIIDATVAGHNSDVLNIVLNDTAAGGISDIGIINAVGVDILNIEAKSLTPTGAAGTTTSYTLDIANTSTALDKVAVTGDIGVNLATALVNSIAEVDASGMTVKKTDAGLTASVASGGSSGVKMTGSGGSDNLTGGDAADIIIGGAGADTITGGAGNDQLTGGADSDTFVFATSAALNGKDTILDFKGGAIAGGGDVFDFGTNFLGTTTVSATTLGLTSGSANQTIADDNVYQITLNTNIADKDFGAANFAELFGSASGQFSTTIASGIDAIVIVKGNDTTHIYTIDDAGDTTLAAGEVDLVGVVTIDGALTTANIA